MSIVQNMLCTPGGGCFIYSLGDGLFMSRVLNGIAMLNNSHILASLAKLGFMLGLLLVAARGVYEQRLALGPMLIGIIVFFGMFGSTTQVTVMDMGGAPGVAPGGAFPVGNVPYGIALVGSMVSNMGLSLSQSMEQAFGLPSGAGGISDGGFGESLRWINAVRNWELPEINSGTGDVAWFKKNLSDYLANCFMNAVDKGQADAGLTFQTKNPWQIGGPGTGGIGVTNQFLTTDIRDSNGLHNYPCNQAFNGLASQVSGYSLYHSFAGTINPRGMKMPPGIGDATQALTNAFQQININATDAQNYVFATALQSAWADMMRHNGQESSLDTLGDIMVSQAAQQRATQWAASESMFRRVAQPMIAFFESMFYACAPFMALCLGFGEWGTRMIGRYLILSIWVMLWFPVLSIINLFQLTMVQHAVNAMQASGVLAQTSVAGAAYLQSQIVDWLSTGAMLASATPAITLMLIFGGAVTASALAGRLGGDAHVDPKVETPDAVKNGAALNNAAQWTGTPGMGVVRTGTEGMQPTISMDHTASVNAMSRDTARASSAQNFNAEYGSRVATDFAALHKGGVSAGHQLGNQATEAEQNVAQLLRGKGVNTSTGSSAAWAAALAVSAKAGVDAGMKFAEGLGLMGGVSGGSSASNENAAKAAFQEAAENKSSWAHRVQIGVAQSMNDVAATNAEESGGKTETVSGSAGYKQAYSDVASKEAQYQTAASEADSVKGSQSMKVMAMAQSLMAAEKQHPGTVDSLISDAHQMGGSAAIENEKAVNDARWASADKKQNDVAAAILTLSGNNFGGGNMPAEYANDRAEALMKHAGQAGFVGASTSGMRVADSDPGKNTSVAEGVTPGQATHAVEAQTLGPDQTAGQTQAQATALQHGNNRATQDALKSVIASAGATGVTKMDMPTLSDPLGAGASKVSGAQAQHDGAIRGDAHKARNDAAWDQQQQHLGETAQFAGRVASVFAHPVDSVYKRGAGFEGAHDRAEGASGYAPATPAQVASMNATYDVIGRNPGQLVGVPQVSSPEMARALTTVATFKQAGGITPQMAQQFDSDMLSMSAPEQAAVMDYANSLTGNELLPGSATAIQGGAVLGVSQVTPGKYR
jgi:hypothetical protein